MSQKAYGRVRCSRVLSASGRARARVHATLPNPFLEIRYREQLQGSRIRLVRGLVKFVPAH